MKNRVYYSFPLVACLALFMFISLSFSSHSLDGFDFIEEDGEEKVYSEVSIDQEFVDNHVIVVMKHESSRINEIPDISLFDSVELTDIIDLTSFEKYRNIKDECDLLFLNEDLFHQILLLELPTNDKNEVVLTIKKLEKLDGVKYVGPDYIYYYNSTPVNDPLIDLQWNINRVQLPQAWDITTGSSDVYVGVVDSGVYEHEDLSNNLLNGWDFYHDNNITSDDVVGHGTLVAGIIGARGNNGIGITGVAHNIKIVPMQVADNFGDVCYNSVAQAITYAISNNIPILNLSIAIDYSDYALKAAFSNYAGLFVCAAGNSGNNIDLYYSFKNDNIIFVANTSREDLLASDSNYGLKTVDLAAPGENIWCTNNLNDYERVSGTSMAAPHVTGVAALIMSIRPDLSATEIKSIILDNVDVLASLEGKCVTSGRLNANKAVRAATESRTFTGDVNGDGRADVILSRKIGNNRALTVYLGKTNGSFEEPITTNSSYSFVYSDPAFAGDFNGDGYTDVLIHWSSGGYRQLLVYISKGDGTFYEGVNLASTRAHNARLYPCSFHIGDVNGDGKDDFIVHWRSTSGYRCALVYKGSSSSPYIIDATTNAIVSSDEYAFNEPVYVGDFNGDGLCDMIVHRSTTDNHRELIIYTGKTDAKFNSSVSLTSVQLFEPADYPTKNFVDDMNGDGKDDFIIQRKSSADYRYAYSYIGKNTSPYIIDASTYALSTTDICKDTDSVLTGDVNGDGKADLIVQWVNSLNKRQLMVYAGNSNNTFNSGINYSTTNNQIPSTYAGRCLVDDVNGDGRDDFIVKWRSGTNIRFLTYLGTTASSFTSGVYTVPTEDVPYYDCDSNGSRYKITCYGTTSCLNIYGDNLTYLNNHQNVTLWSDSGSNEQKWLISSIGDNVYIRSIIDETFGLNVYRVGSPFNCDVYPVSGNETDAAVDFISTSGGYRIKLHNYNLYLTASSTANGANVYWDSYSSSSYQVWSLTPTS